MGQEPPGSRNAGCADCTSCGSEPALPHGASEQSGAGAPDDDSTLDEARFALASAGTFLVPVILAVLGSLLAGESPVSRFLGGTIGLVVGLVGAVVAGKLLR